MGGYDAIVVGGGSAGLAYARTACSRGASVLCIEADKFGGTCVNRGCVPKKLLWSVAETLHDASRLAGNAVLDTHPTLDFARLHQQITAKVDGIREEYRSMGEAAGVDLRHGRATITPDLKVELDGEALESERIVVATGAVPTRPDFPGAELAEVSDDVFRWADLPASLLILGGGYVGCEFAAILRAFGVAVTLADPGDRLLSKFAAPLAEAALKNLREMGVDVRLGDTATSLERADGRVRAQFESGGTAVFDRVLAATGRTPNLDVLADGLSPEIADSGALRIDDGFETTVPGLFAVGDVADRLPLTPVAVADGETLGNIHFGDGASPVPLGHVTQTAFLLPPVAQVGTLDGAAFTAFSPLPGAVRTLSPESGWLRHHDDSRRLRGVGLAGPAAPEAIGWAAQVVAAGRTREDLCRALAIHPTEAEEPLR